MTENNLLPCPFCGGEAVLIRLDELTGLSNNDINFDGDVIECNECQCSTRVIFGEREGLREIWNSRCKPDIQNINDKDIERLANTCWQHLSGTKIDPGFGPGNQAKDIITDYFRIVQRNTRPSPELPTDKAARKYKTVPLDHPVTSEMKAACIGEFSFTTEEAKFDDDGEYVGTYDRENVVPWDTCKEIYKAMLASAPSIALPQLDNDELVEELENEIIQLAHCARRLKVNNRDFDQLFTAIIKCENRLEKHKAKVQ